MERWTAEQVTGLAPDAASVAAGRKQAAPAIWTAAGCDDVAVWGAAQGSGKTPYRVAVDLTGPAFRCSCPSRKVPCKHVLGLLYRWAAGELPAGTPDADVREWLDARAERAGAAATRAAARAGKDADPAAQARTADRRAASITAGCEDLDRWLADLLRQGLAAARERPASSYDEQARRLVDAKAPALAARVRRLGGHAHAGGDDWPQRTLREAAMLHLAVRAWARADELPADLRKDLRALVGWSRPLDQVRETGEPLAGPWAVVSVGVDDETARVRTRRTWLLREDDARPALLLEFAGGPGPFATPALPVGGLLDGTLRAFPGRSGLRVLRDGDAALGAWPGPPPTATIDAALGRWGAAVAADPFCDRIAVALHAVTAVRARGDAWLREPGGAALRLGGDGPWSLLSAAGGRPVGVAGVWDGTRLHASCVITGGRAVPLAADAPEWAA